MSNPTTNLNLMLILKLFLITLPTKGGVSADVELHPVMEYYTTATPIQHRQAAAARELTPFQLCLDCRCCAANNASNCSTMPCCFGIDCNLPDKPFGVCAFVPKTCNCTSCQ
ncbi:uncharacterized protein LOC135675516 [Musa acuminata AAA Group]|uniref:uncharacterized protein LOC103971061 n=1 Tax=Musa acuminata AAA Group TaxID=214697 RepID=UPI0031D975DE